MTAKNKNTYFKLPILDGLQLLEANHHTFNFPFHTHNTFNITLVVDQVFSTKTSNRFLSAPVGTIVITSPDEVHATICDNKIGNSFITFYVSPDVLTALNNKKPVSFENKIINDSLIFQQSLNLFKYFRSLNTEMEKGLLKVLRALVIKHSTTTYTENKKSIYFRKFLEDEPFNKFSLENSANKFGMDKFKFLRLFKNETGLTPNNYIILKRIEKCKQLLQTKNDLLDIAIELGFYDAAHLCRHFKRITGISPLAFRNA